MGKQIYKERKNESKKKKKNSKINKYTKFYASIPNNKK